MGTRPFGSRSCGLNGCAGAVNGFRGRETNKKKAKSNAPLPQHRGGHTKSCQGLSSRLPAALQRLRAGVIDFKAKKKRRRSFLSRPRETLLATSGPTGNVGRVRHFS